MGTIVAAYFNNQISLAVDALNVTEEIVQPSLNVAPRCILRVGESLIGLQSSYSYQQAVEHILASIGSNSLPTLHTPHEIRHFFNRLHDALCTQFRFNAATGGGTFENSPMNALLVNRAGIFKIDSTRAVYQFTKFWALGSGEAFALGALHALYGTASTSEALVRSALAACGEFEASRGKHIHVVTIAASPLSALSLDNSQVSLRENSDVRNKGLPESSPRSMTTTKRDRAFVAIDGGKGAKSKKTPSKKRK